MACTPCFSLAVRAVSPSPRQPPSRSFCLTSRGTTPMSVHLGVCVGVCVRVCVCVCVCPEWRGWGCCRVMNGYRSGCWVLVTSGWVYRGGGGGGRERERERRGVGLGVGISMDERSGWVLPHDFNYDIFKTSLLYRLFLICF